MRRRASRRASRRARCSARCSRWSAPRGARAAACATRRAPSISTSSSTAIAGSTSPASSCRTRASTSVRSCWRRCARSRPTRSTPGSGGASPSSPRRSSAAAAGARAPRFAAPLRLRRRIRPADDGDVAKDDSARASSLPAVEVARLEAMRRLSMGAAHALNNAFTAVVGEASFLREEHKDQAEVVDACDAILHELERCTRMTRALLSRRHPPQGGRDEVDLVRLVRDLAALLGETLGRQKELAVQLPDDLLLVRGEAAALELLVLLLVLETADLAPSGAKLALRVVPAGPCVRLELEIEADGLAEDAARAFEQPERAEHALARNQLAALAELAAQHGGRCFARREGACHLVAAAELPRLGA